MTRRVVDGGFSEAWQGKRMHGKTQPSGTTQEKGPEPAGSGRAEAFPRPGPAIPCWVAPQQSPTPFRQATVILPYLSAVGRKLPLAEPSKIDTKRLPGRASKIDTKRLPGPCLAAARLTLYTTDINAIIVRRPSPSPTPCRF